MSLFSKENTSPFINNILSGEKIKKMRDAAIEHIHQSTVPHNTTTEAPSTPVNKNILDHILDLNPEQIQKLKDTANIKIKTHSKDIPPSVSIIAKPLIDQIITKENIDRIKEITQSSIKHISPSSTKTTDITEHAPTEPTIVTPGADIAPLPKTINIPETPIDTTPKTPSKYHRVWRYAQQRGQQIKTMGATVTPSTETINTGIDIASAIGHEFIRRNPLWSLGGTIVVRSARKASGKYAEHPIVARTLDIAENTVLGTDRVSKPTPAQTPPKEPSKWGAIARWIFRIAAWFAQRRRK